MEITYPNLQPFYRQVFDSAVSDESVASELQFIDCFFEEWAGNFVPAFGNDLYHHGKEESILYSYLASQSLVFDWLAHSLIFGHYHTVLRELRTILENIFYMYSLDLRFKGKEVKEKLKVLQNSELRGKEPHGKAVFEKSGYPDWKQSYTLYRELCKFVHIHTKTSAYLALEIVKRGFPEALEITYDRNSFLQCSNVWRKLARSSLALAMDLCQRLNVETDELHLMMKLLSKIW